LGFLSAALLAFTPGVVLFLASLYRHGWQPTKERWKKGVGLTFSAAVVVYLLLYGAIFARVIIKTVYQDHTNLVFENARLRQENKSLRQALEQLTVAKPSDLRILYKGKELDGQTIALHEVADPSNPVQTEMAIDPRFPSTFITFGIRVVNTGEAPAELQWAYLKFSARVAKDPRISSPWQPTNGEGTEFSYFLNRTPISPGQPPMRIPEFYGTSLADRSIKGRLRIFYGKSVQANFTIRPSG